MQQERVFLSVHKMWVHAAILYAKFLSIRLLFQVRENVSWQMPCIQSLPNIHPQFPWHGAVSHTRAFNGDPVIRVRCTRRVYQQFIFRWPLELFVESSSQTFCVFGKLDQKWSWPCSNPHPKTKISYAFPRIRLICKIPMKINVCSWISIGFNEFCYFRWVFGGSWWIYNGF